MNRKALIFAAAVAAQVLILAAMPLSKAYTRATGRTVVLKVAPVDPYTILSGYYVRLGYEVNSPAGLAENRDLTEGRTVYTVIEQQPDGIWRAVRMSAVPPASLPPNQVFLRGRQTYSRVEYGIEEFYIPEDKRGVIENDLRENASQARVEVKVDSRGNAALVRLLIGNRVYE
jgi:uncharacterized membrane-anchored protein